MKKYRTPIHYYVLRERLLLIVGFTILTFSIVGTSLAQTTQTTTAATPQSAEAIIYSDSAWSVIQYPANKEIIVNLMPINEVAANFVGIARVTRRANHTIINIKMAAKMEMLNKKGGDFLGRRIGATGKFRLCDGSELKIEDGRIEQTDEKCPRGSVIVHHPPEVNDLAALNLYAVDLTGKVTLLGPVNINSGAVTQAFTTPLDKFMLVLSLDNDLTVIDANTHLAFRSAVPQGFAVIPLMQSAPNYAAVQGLRFPRPSQRASVIQTVGVTDVTVTYSRPGVKGRTIWGDAPAGAATTAATLDDSRTRAKDAAIVPYGHVWRTGANEATLFIVTDDVMINGQPLKAGTYSLHSIPGRDEWTIIFNSDAGQWGSFAYDEKKDVLRVKAKPQMVAENQELLTFSIDPTGESSARVNIRWEKLTVPLIVEVKDVKALTLEKMRATVAAAKADDWRTPLQAANYVFTNNLSNTDEAMRWLEKSIKTKETFGNTYTKARVLAGQGKNTEAVALGEKALQMAKAPNSGVDPTTIADLEKRMADWKSKM